MPNSIFDDYPLLKRALAGGEEGIPQVGQSMAIPQQNPFSAPLAQGAGLMQQMLNAQQMPGQAPMPLPPPSQDFTSGVPTLTQGMFQNPGYSPQRMAALGNISDRLMQDAVGGDYDPKTGKMTTAGKMRKYGGAAGDVLSGLGGIFAALGPAGAAKGYNEYFKEAQKNSENRRKMEAENRRHAVEALDKLAEVMGKSRQTTTNDIKNILQANQAQAKVDTLNAGKNVKDAEWQQKQAELSSGLSQAKTISELMQGVQRGAAGQKDVAASGAQDALARQRDAAADKNRAQAQTEGTKQTLNSAKAGTEESKAKLNEIKGKTETAQQGLLGAKTKTQGDVQTLLKQKAIALAAKTKATADTSTKVDKHLYDHLPPGAGQDPRLQQARAALVKKGMWNEASASYLINKFKALPEYQKKKGGLPALKPIGAQHG